MAKSKNILTAWQRLVRMLKLDKKDVRQIFYYAIFAGLVGLSLPLGIQAIINLIQGAQISTSWIILVILVTLGVAFGGVLQLMQIRITENIQQKIFTRSSFEFAYRFPKIKMSELHGIYPPELANRFFDTLTIQKSLSKILVDYPTALLQIIFGLILLSFYHPFFIIYGFLLVLLVYILFKFTAQKGLDSSLMESQSKYKVAHWLQEVARSIVSFKLSGKTTLAVDKNDQLTSEYLKHREKHFNVLISQFTQMIGFKVLVTAGLLLIGGILVLSQEMNIGQFVAAELIILIIIGAVEKLITGLESVYDVLTSLEKLGNVVDKELEPMDGEKPFKDDDNFSVDLEHVTYEVEDRSLPIINDVSLKITQSCNIALRGSNGSGKATLLRLITGIIEPTHGNIYVNNTDLRGVNLNYYRSHIGQSLTEESPFEGTLRENITFGDPEITDDQVYWALSKVGLNSFLKKLPLGLKTMLFPEGKQLSYTVSKKIVLARSVVRKPKMLILKDPLDQFDDAEADRIMEFLTDKSNGWSLVVVSQNPAWITKCSRVVTLDQGKLIEDK
ncbi:peptidase domain-containing ABC transporter [Nonlabens ulvanivorans]|uniref:ABC transporter ATP-binding protein n=1 Tax=Nonlabens ulvanivorans TaxID=906888 RepID=A0A084JXM2_NONUL|nr:ATP-binding cassette domain-containing protein [Nonlabens ulvanivorans]KEZ93706.1 ABC transporter ATP-binding protein [Nonlabens ulvanivorans]PRX14299.1 ABC-type bacteriocin/lantibiotic exporter with double-glycine peptidase domain [Nonlabens ulvanivorans]